MERDQKYITIARLDQEFSINSFYPALRVEYFFRNM